MRRIILCFASICILATLFSYESKSQTRRNFSEPSLPALSHDKSSESPTDDLSRRRLAAFSRGEQSGSFATDVERLSRLSSELFSQSIKDRKLALKLADSLSWPVIGKTLGGRRFELQGLWAGFPIYYIETNNTDAAATTGTDSVQYYIGGGPGLTIGLWDGGAPRMTHQELIGRVSWGDSKTPVADDHATHVSGTLAGSGVRPQARGMAPEANVKAFEWTNDLAEMAHEASCGLVVSNHSYGYIRGWANLGGWYWFGDTAISEIEDYLFGFYSASSRALDEILCAAPNYLPVFAAGNDRNDSVPPGTPHYYFDVRYNSWRRSTKVRNNDGSPLGYDCLPNGAPLAKNALLVGAVKPVLEYLGPQSVEMTPYSSFGPTDDGRIKPDICGDGWAVYSSTAGSDTSYNYYYGTSMASPNVCGSLGLLQDYYRDNHYGVPMRAATLKALVVHTAREAGPAQGPDYGFGWGLLDAYSAFRLIRDDLDDRLGLIEELVLLEDNPMEFRYFCDGRESQLKVTIAWTDPPGTPPAPALDPLDRMLVNDLDLRLEKDGSVFEPWKLDPLDPSAPATRGDNSVDNVEQVVIENPEEGIYVVRVYNDGPLEGGSQDFSLVVSGARRTATWHVFTDGSGDAPTIAAAVDSAMSGDLILVYPGIYREHDIVVDKAVTIKGIRGASLTIVNAEGLGRCFVIQEDAGPVSIEGLTLKNGSASGVEEDGYGGGIFCADQQASIIGCVLKGNSATRGAGIFARNGLRSLVQCTIRGNKASQSGGGLYLEGCDIELHKCTLAWNESMGDGGALYLADSKVEIGSCTFAYNWAFGHGGGIYIAGNSEAAIYKSIISFTLCGEGLYRNETGGEVSLSCCTLFGNAMGDAGGTLNLKQISDRVIFSDPQFCDAFQFEFGIGDGSPCLPTGNECGELIGAEGSRCHTKTTWYVASDGSGDAPTISAAIERASHGDTILLEAGVFTGNGNWDIVFGGKNLVVRSENGPDFTTVDCGASRGDVHFGFSYEAGETATSVLEGITIRNASNGGIRCIQSSPVIKNCTIDSCSTNGATRGGGIYLEKSNARIAACVLTRNIANPTGGAIYMRESAAIVEDCIVSGNSAIRYGGGIGIHTGSNARIARCTVSGNSAIGDHGGGIYVVSASAVIDSCTISGNSGSFGGGVYFGLNSHGTIKNSLVSGNAATSGGGGIYANSNTIIENCTVAGNQCPLYGSGIESVSASMNSIARTIVAFNSGSQGLYSVSGLQPIACSDVYGNPSGDYGGSTPNQTGTNGNFSLDPGFCDASVGNYALYDTSACSPQRSPCSALVGALDVECRIAPNLVIESITPSTLEAFAGDSLTFEIVVRNTGILNADSFAIDCFLNEDVSPTFGRRSDIRIWIATLAVGDTVVRRIGSITSDTVDVWHCWFSVDATGCVVETDEKDNVSGPYLIVWNIPEENGWPVYCGATATSALICDLDGNDSTLEVIVGCSDGKVRAWSADGNSLDGWSVSLDGAIKHAPAAGNIDGDPRCEIVVGSENGTLYAFDRAGRKLWEVALSDTLAGSPVLADLDRDGHDEILCSAGGILYALRGDGSTYPGLWPLHLGTENITAPAVGDVDGDGELEIASIAWSIGSSESKVFLLKSDGSFFGAHWPIAADTILAMSPVIGDIAGHHGNLEIAAASGSRIYAWNSDGSACFAPVRVTGHIESLPALADLDDDGYLDIAVTSRFAREEDGNTVWDGRIFAAGARSGLFLSKKISQCTEDLGALSGPISIGKEPDLIIGTQEGIVLEALGGYSFETGGAILATLAAGDLDGDGWVELLAATEDDSLRCFELRRSRMTPTTLWWPQERRTASRTACYGYEPVSGIEEKPETTIPASTMIRALFPNPFNPTVSIYFDLAMKARVRVAIYDISGREIAVLFSREAEPGSYEISWDGRNTEGKGVSSGLYFCLLKAGDRIETRKMILLR